jgi:hypothetical protein
MDVPDKSSHHYRLTLRSLLQFSFHCFIAGFKEFLKSFGSESSLYRTLLGAKIGIRGNSRP